jgi:hypothetical protein
MMGDVIGLS